MSQKQAYVRVTISSFLNILKELKLVLFTQRTCSATLLKLVHENLSVSKVAQSILIY